MFRTILTTLDGSEFGERALDYTRNFAALAGAQVHLLTVIEALASPSEPPTTPDEEPAQRCLAYLEGRAQDLRAEGIADIVPHVMQGDPARLIAELARDVQAGVIVMSTQGLGADGRYALGSVALKVLMTAPCPVFMVRINKPEPPRSLAEERWQGEGGANVG